MKRKLVSKHFLENFMDTEKNEVAHDHRDLKFRNALDSNVVIKIRGKEFDVLETGIRCDGEFGIPKSTGIELSDGTPVKMLHANPQQQQSLAIHDDSVFLYFYPAI